MRYYDSSIGQWMTCDPAGQYFSPYVYCGNSPINFVDVLGLQGERHNNKGEDPFQEPKNPYEQYNKINQKVITKTIEVQKVIDETLEPIEDVIEITEDVIERTEAVAVELNVGKKVNLKKVGKLEAKAKLKISTDGDVIAGLSAGGKLGSIDFLNAGAEHNFKTGENAWKLQSNHFGIKASSSGKMEVTSSKFLGFVEVKVDNTGYTKVKSNTGTFIDIELKLRTK